MKPIRAVLVCALLASTWALPAAAAPAEPEPPPTLTGVTTIASTGPGWVDVRLPEDATVALAPDPPRAPGWATITTTGRYAALVLVSASERLGGGTVAVNLMQVHIPAPYGCRASGGGCLSPYEHVVFQVGTPPSPAGGRWLYRYPAGDYRLYLLTDPGASATATFRLEGSEGETDLTAEAPAVAAFDIERAATAPFSSLHGSYVRSLGSPGFVTMGIYQLGGTPGVNAGPFAYQECLTRGTPGPASPDDCLPAFLLTPTTGDVTVAGRPVLIGPTFFAGSFGGFSLDDSGLAAWQSRLLSAETWTNTYRIYRGGADAAVAAWALWLETGSL